MNEDKTALNKAIVDIENSAEIKKLPPQVRAFLKEWLGQITKVPFPVATFRENNWVIATTPLIDVCAQGKSEEEAINNLIAMIDDYMTDPHTIKPKIETMINMQVSVKAVPINLSLGSMLSANSGVVANAR